MTRETAAPTEIEHVTDAAWIQDYYGPEPRRHRAGLRRKRKFWPFGAKWQETADRVIGYTLLERRGP